MDKLDDLFEKQKLLQQKMGVTFNQEYISTMTLACTDELFEALRETPWKPWKKTQELNVPKFKQELVDAWHFLINLSLASGMTADELHVLYMEKNKVNHDRRTSNY